MWYVLVIRSKSDFSKNESEISVFLTLRIPNSLLQRIFHAYHFFGVLPYPGYVSFCFGVDWVLVVRLRRFYCNFINLDVISVASWLSTKKMKALRSIVQIVMKREKLWILRRFKRVLITWHLRSLDSCNMKPNNRIKMVQNDDTLGVWDRGCQLDSDTQDNLAYDNRLLGPVIGIDLGTSNSCVSLWHTVKNRAKVVKNVSTKSKIVVTCVRHNDACLKVHPQSTPTTWLDSSHTLSIEFDFTIALSILLDRMFFLSNFPIINRTKHSIHCGLRWCWFWLL
jgi:hypothetical protein